jgi:hypothetical protein
MRRAHVDERPFPSIPRMLSRTPPLVYVSVVLPVAMLMAAAVLQPWLPPTDLMRDSQVVAARHDEASPAYGLVSNLGIVVLALSSGGAVTARLILRDARAPFPRLLLWIAGLSLVLVLDDLLLLHEAATFAPWAGALVVVTYGFAFLRFGLTFRDVIVHDLDVGLLLLAVGSLGVSAATDLLVPATQPSVLVEDGAKLLGLVAWSAFALRTVLVAARHSGATTTTSTTTATSTSRSTSTSTSASSGSDATSPVSAHEV